MKVYYYTCPRCGRVWKKYLPHPVMQCKFCDETWHTAGRKGTKSRFSLTATLLWLAWGLAILFVIWKAATFLGINVPGAKNNPNVITVLPETADEEASDSSEMADSEASESGGDESASDSGETSEPSVTN